MKLLAAFLACLASPAMAGECLLAPPAPPQPGMSVVAPEMQRRPTPDALCVPAGVALARIRAQQQAADAAASYVKQTEFDNSPYRFNMSQDGRRMTAEEFDAWMKAKGIRVAKGRPAVPTAPPPPPTAPPAADAAAPEPAPEPEPAPPDG